MEDTEIDMEEGGVQNSVARYWDEILKIKTAMGQMQFPTLGQVMIAVLSLLNNEMLTVRERFLLSEKCIQRVIKSLNADTLTLLLQCKL